MAINVSVQHNGGFLPRHYNVVVAMLLPSGNPFKCHEEVLYSHLTVLLTYPPLAGGCSEGLDAFSFFFKHTAHHANTNTSICTGSDVTISKPYPDTLQYFLVSPVAVCNTLIAQEYFFQVS